MEETYQLIEGSPTLRDLDAENGFLWCPFGHSGRQNEPGILISRLDDGSYDVRLGTGFDSPERFATGDPDWSWMDLSVASTVDATFADDMALSDWIASETTATGAAWARCFNPGCGPDGETCDAKEITAALKRFESPSYIARGAIEDIESLPVGYYWCPDAVDPDPSYNGYLLNVFAGFDGRGLPGKFFELFGGVTLNDVPSFGFDDGWDGSCLNRLDWFEDAVGMDPDGLSAGLVANDIESVKALVGNCPAWIECAPSYSEKAARGVDDVVQAVKAYRANAIRVDRKVISPGVSQSACSRARGPRRQIPQAGPMAAPGSISRRAICMDYFSRKPDFPTFEDIYIARAQGAIELERRGDEVACRFGPDGPAFMLPQGATRGDIIRGCLACDGIVGALRENAGMRSAAAGWLDSYFTEVAGRAPVGETCSADCLFACHVDIDGIYAERTGNPDGLRAYCDPMGVGWNHGPIYYFPRESIEQIVAQLIDDGDDFPVLFDGERVIEAFDGSPVHMSVPVEVDGEKVWTCGYDFCWGETVAPDFSRARGRFPDATVAAWAAERSVNGSDVNLGIKERML